jgi:hypothetical protein
MKIRSFFNRTLAASGGIQLFRFVRSPQCGAYSMTRFFLLFFLISLPCFGQAWSGILSPSRAIDWTHAGLPATLPDGEATPNPWTPPVRTQCGSTISAGASAPTINAALAACPTGTYVLLGTGNFTISSANITLYAQNAVSLRGSGPMSTTLTLTGSSVIQFGSANFGSASCSWTAGYAQGSTSITLSSCSGTPVVGNIVELQQCDSGFSGSGCTIGSSTDSGALYICAGNTACQRGGEGLFNLPTQEQNVLVTSVTGNCTSSCTLGFTAPLYMPNWSSGNSPRASWAKGAHGVAPYGNGLEDLTVVGSGLTVNEPIDFASAYASWVKGVRFLGAGSGTVISLHDGKNCLVANNYIFSDVVLDSNYPSGMQEGGDSDDLVINNMMLSGVPWDGTGHMEGDVIAYNYTRDQFTAYVLNIFEHADANAFLLYESNETPSIQEDDTHGTHDLSTTFRNYIRGWESPYVSANFAGENFDAFNRFTNSVGNVIGTSGILTNYQATPSSHLPNFVYSFSSTSSAHDDPLVLATALRWGNCDTATNTCRFQSSEVPTTLEGNAVPFENAVPSSNTLPCSFFLPGYTSTSCTAHPSGGTGLSFWKVCTNWTAFPTGCAATQTQPFPTAGPDVTGGPYNGGLAYDIPAEVAWKNLPIDPAYQKTYSITSSSWSGGTETLTISGLPNVTHLLGGFQITGTSGCNSPAGGEFLMTGSNSATVSYALASNPGSCAGGSFMFPDVRQFDESVYESDQGGASGGGGGQPPSPTNLTTTVE